MSSTRTQVYLTEMQRLKIDQMAHAEGVAMAEIVRRALDRYLSGDPDATAALAATFGACPRMEAPSRDRELGVDRAIAERAGRIAREFGIRLPDALIAGTALEHNLALVTRNTKHFQAIRGLRLRSL